MAEKQTPSLLPCPFCQGAATAKLIPETNGDWHHVDVTHIEGCFYKPKAERLLLNTKSLTAWNTRTAPAPAEPAASATQAGAANPAAPATAYFSGCHPTPELERMTAGRASFFMERFLKDEKLLGPNEQAALHFVIALLDTPAAPVVLPEPVVWLIERSAFQVSPHGQDAESQEWLEEAHEPGEEGSFPVYTEQQVHTLLASLAPPAPAAVAVPDEVPESVIDAVAEALGDAYDCGRVWSAWGVGTMSQDDFYLVAEDGDRVAEIAREAITAHLAATPAAKAEVQPTSFQVQAITTAYEQGVGKGNGAHQRGFEVNNPYSNGYRCDEAWNLGYQEGKRQAAVKAAVQAEPVAWMHTNILGGVQAFTTEPPPGLKEKCQPLYTAPHATQPGADAPMVNMTPPATSRDRWMYEQGRLAEREIICAAIKTEDDYCVAKGDYMLDSDDCINVARGSWVRPDFEPDAAMAAKEL